MKRLQFSLRTLLLLSAFLGRLAGLWIRWEPDMVRVLPDAPFEIGQAEISPDGNRVMTFFSPSMFDTARNRANAIDVWRTHDGAHLHRFEGGLQIFDAFNQVMFSPSGNWIYMESASGAV